MNQSATVRAARVLVVDDDEDSRFLLEQLLESWGYHVYTAGTASEALRHALNSTPDVALVDLGLPDVDGCAVARRLREMERGASIQLIALTGYSDAATRETAHRAGFDDYLVKPLAPATLQQLLAHRVRPATCEPGSSASNARTAR